MTFNKGDTVEYIGGTDPGWNLQPGAQAIVSTNYVDGNRWLYLEWIPSPLVGKAGTGGFIASQFKKVDSNHKFKVGDIVEWVKRMGGGFDAIQDGALATVKGYKKNESGTIEYMFIEWHKDGKHGLYNSGGWYEDQFRLHKKIRLDDKAFDQIIVPHRPRPMKWKE